jgi:hypothetical protein
MSMKRIRTEEGDETLDPLVSEIECERHFGSYKNYFPTHVHGPKDTTYIYNGIF